MENNTPILSACEKTSALQRAVGYLAILAANGRSISSVPAMTGLDFANVKELARKYKVEFCDYSPNSKPQLLKWGKVQRGLWELITGDSAIGECKRDGQDYVATAYGITVRNKRAASAMKGLSREIDALSFNLFKRENATFSLEDENGRSEVLWP